MRDITKLHNIYKNNPIWIAGSDPSLSSYPDDYLDGKISITLHLANLKFPKATYRYFNEYDRLVYLMKDNPEILKQKNIFGWPFFNKSKEHCRKLVGNPKNTYYLDLKPYPPDGDPTDIFMERGVKAMELLVKTALEASSATFGGSGTCLHPCMYVAVMMGANSINIIGCNFKNIDGKEHFGNAGRIDKEMRPNIASFTSHRGDKMTRGFNAIVKGCNGLGIKINRIRKYE